MDPLIQNAVLFLPFGGKSRSDKLVTTVYILLISPASLGVAQAKEFVQVYEYMCKGRMGVGTQDNLNMLMEVGLSCQT